MTRQQAIRLKCVDCSGANALEVKLCPVYACPLWDYRLGAKKKRTISAVGGWVADRRLHQLKMQERGMG